MFIRKKHNRSGSVSIQVIDKVTGKYRVVKTIGSSADLAELERLKRQGTDFIASQMGQRSLNFDEARERELVELFFGGIQQIRLLGPELLLGKLFDDIGFGGIPDELFRWLVIARLCHPASKLKTVYYLYKYRGISVDVGRIYRYLDKFHKGRKAQAEKISYEHTLKVLGGAPSFVFYDVTTLYFEAADGDDLRRAGFSKEGRHQNPQVLLGLLVSADGYPLAYDIFEGNKYEGHTMLPVIVAFKEKYKLEKLVVVADAGLMSNDNVAALGSGGYGFIIGARIKNEAREIREKILSLSPSDGDLHEMRRRDGTRLIIGYSSARAKKDAANRRRGLEKLEKALGSGKLTKGHINNRGYNKYLKMEGDVSISVDYEKWELDARWDGLKGVATNTDLTAKQIVGQYSNLWKIEKAFRISKTDLKIRPIYHRLKNRIEAHICIAFCAYKIYKELERQLKAKQSPWSPEKAIDIANTIFQISMVKPYSKTVETRILVQNEEQKELLTMFGLSWVSQ